MKITFILPHASLEGGIRVVAIYTDLLRQKGPEGALLREKALKLGVSDSIIL